MFIDLETKKTINEKELDYYNVVEVEDNKKYCLKAPTFVVVSNLKARLEKYKQDVEQVELFGMERLDYEEKKQRCAEIILELRHLEREVDNETNN